MPQLSAHPSSPHSVTMVSVRILFSVVLVAALVSLSTATYLAVPLGGSCSASRQCARSLYCEHGTCKRWAGPGERCGPDTNNKCWLTLTCYEDLCKRWVGFMRPCGRKTSNRCWSELFCSGRSCLRWVGPGSPCGLLTFNKCWSELKCENGTCQK